MALGCVADELTRDDLSVEDTFGVFGDRVCGHTPRLSRAVRLGALPVLTRPACDLVLLIAAVNRLNLRPGRWRQPKFYSPAA